jgi:hypothetical protein
VGICRRAQSRARGIVTVMPLTENSRGQIQKKG